MNFDRVARPYRFLERLVYGDALQASRLAHLGKIAGSPRVLLLGDGDGRFLRALLEQAPAAKVEVVEASAKMIELAKRDLPEGSKVTFHHVRISDFELAGEFDLVVSHYFLDCFDEGGIAAVVDQVAGGLKPGGHWLVSDFQMPDHGWLRRLRARFLLRSMYLFFRVAAGLKAKRLVDPQSLLCGRGFALDSREISNVDFLRADCWRR